LCNIYGKYTTAEEIVKYLTVCILLERTFFMVLEPYLNEQKGKVHGNINSSDFCNSSLAFVVPIEYSGREWVLCRASELVLLIYLLFCLEIFLFIIYT
jgi:hypothetical protein